MPAKKVTWTYEKAWLKLVAVAETHGLGEPKVKGTEKKAVTGRIRAEAERRGVAQDVFEAAMREGARTYLEDIMSAEVALAPMAATDAAGLMIAAA
jgi:hypothetical protein